MSEMKKIFVGQRVREFPARSYEKVIRGEERDRGKPRPADVRTGSPHSPVIVKLRWDGASAVEPGAVVKLVDALFEPDAEFVGGSFGLAFTADVFAITDDSSTPYAITMGPIAASTVDGQEVGYGVIPEAWWARVNISDAAHTHAAQPLSGTLLVSGTSGLRIVWKQAGTGEKWAVVEMLKRPLRIIKGFTTGVVSAAAGTFQIETVSSTTNGPPPEPVTIIQAFPVGYASGQAVLAHEQQDGTWVNTPDSGKMRTSSADLLPNYLHASILDHDTYAAIDHQLVYAQAVDSGGGDYVVRLFTALDGGSAITKRFAIAYSTIAAATGNISGSITPGTGLVSIYTFGATAGAAATVDAQKTAENYMRAAVTVGKPLFVFRRSLDPEIWVVDSEGCEAVPEE